MQIRPTSNIQTSSVNLQPQNTTRSAGAQNPAPVDQLDISAEAQMMSAASTSGDIRADRVADIRAQIADGRYDTNEKLEAAVSRMFDELA